MTPYEMASLWGELSVAAYRVEQAANQQNLDLVRQWLSKANATVEKLIQENGKKE